MKQIIGIDPGKKGAVATLLIQPGGTFKLDAYPRIDDAASLKKLLDSLVVHSTLPTYLVIEITTGSPKMGWQGAQTFGKGYGYLHMWALCNEHLLKEYKRVRPQDWQAAVSARTGGDKSISKARAKELFPSFKVTLENADALLIAYYGYLKYGR